MNCEKVGGDIEEYWEDEVFGLGLCVCEIFV